MSNEFIGIKDLPLEARGIRLAKINSKDELILCEPVMFTGGWEIVHMVLRRASVSGRVEIRGKIDNHFLDILDENGNMIESAALDKESYSALKNKWARCKINKFEDVLDGVFLKKKVNL